MQDGVFVRSLADYCSLSSSESRFSYVHSTKSIKDQHENVHLENLRK